MLNGGTGICRHEDKESKEDDLTTGKRIGACWCITSSGVFVQVYAHVCAVVSVTKINARHTRPYSQNLERMPYIIPGSAGARPCRVMTIAFTGMVMNRVMGSVRYL